jgi:DNA (cytosine-5)-methyltransferase 1
MLIADTLRANGGSGGRYDKHPMTVTHALRADGFDASEDGTGRGVPLIPIAFSVKDHGADAGDIAPTLRAGGFTNSHANGGCMPAIAFTNQWGDENPDAFSTLKADCNGALPMVQSGMQVRRLTPRECERLQGFHDDYTLISYNRKPAKDGPRYKALGNSMAVPTMRWIGRRIQLVDEILKEQAA